MENRLRGGKRVRAEWVTRATVREAVLDAFEVLSPVVCAGCDAEERAVCSGCRSQLSPHLQVQTLAGGLPVWSALRYEDRVRRVILSVKESGRTDAIRFLVPALRQAVAAAVNGEVELARVPTSAAAYRRRGYDPVRSMLTAARLPSVRVLEQARSTRRQKTLDIHERSENLIGSMRACRTLRGRRFVIVDDVLTTGSTVLEAARAIMAADGEVVSAATLAFTPRRVSDSLRSTDA